MLVIIMWMIYHYCRYLCNLMGNSDFEPIYGVLSWINDNMFRYNALNEDTESCWITTLDGDDGIIVQFVTDSNGDVDGLMIPDIVYGTVLKKKNDYDETQNVNHSYLQQKYQNEYKRHYL